MSEPLLELKKVSQNYTSGRRTFTAVQDINLALGSGDGGEGVGHFGVGDLLPLERPERVVE